VGSIPIASTISISLEPWPDKGRPGLFSLSPT
jgi:hypothetical protein